MKNVAIFLGAGASASEGAPIQSRLFKDYFQHVKGDDRHFNMDRELATFFLYFFGIDVDSDKIEDINFPTFEEVLGIIDLAITRNESFKEFDLENKASNSGRLRFVRLDLILLMTIIIHEKLKGINRFHSKLINNLDKLNMLNRTAFISSNYDILIDNALAELVPNYRVDYGIRFDDVWNDPNKNAWLVPSSDAIKLFKLHGSLNWIFCQTCNSISLSVGEKGIMRLIEAFEEAYCSYCQSVYSPLIVPPSYVKDLSNAFLCNIWNQCEHTLREADQIIFCGYSFPDADINIKYLLKRIQTNRKKTLEFTIVNWCDGKRDNDAEIEKGRYIRFLGGKNKIEYTRISFEEFAEEPESIMK